MFNMKRQVRGSMLCRGLFLMLFLFLISTFFMAPAFAIGGLQTAKVTGISTGVTTLLRGAALGIVTPIIMWNGYGIMCRTKTFKECFPIALGCLCISGAAEIAILLLA